MDFLELAQSRRSIREFLEKDISHEDVIKLLQAARTAPSAGNCQPWHFYVVRDKTIQSAVAEAAGGRQPFILAAPVMFIVCAEPQRNEKRYGVRGRTLYCIQDTAAAIQNLLLCAKDLGLGACWCGAFDENAVSGILRLPEERRPIAVIPVGYPANEPPVPTKRRSLEEIVTYIGAGRESQNDGGEEKQRMIAHCDMGDTVFEDVNLAGSRFSDINFNGVEIAHANLSGGRIHDCDLTNFTITDCILNGMTINGKTIDS